MKISVVLPTYNRLAFLQKALLSVKMQTYHHYECLIVNDSPSTKEEVSDLVQRIGDERFKLIHHDQNKGVSEARNTALKIATGDLIMLLDDDDEWLPACMEKHLEAHQKNPEAGLVYSGYIQKWESEILSDKVYRTSSPPKDIVDSMQKGKFALPCASIISMKKACIDDIGIFDSNIPTFEDWDLCYRVAKKYAFSNIEEPLVIYNAHLGVRGTSSLNKRLASLDGLIKKWSKDPLGVLQKNYKFSAYFLSSRSNLLAKEYHLGLQQIFLLLRNNKITQKRIRPIGYLILLFLFGRNNFKIAQTILIRTKLIPTRVTRGSKH